MADSVMPTRSRSATARGRCSCGALLERLQYIGRCRLCEPAPSCADVPPTPRACLATNLGKCRIGIEARSASGNPGRRPERLGTELCRVFVTDGTNRTKSYHAIDDHVSARGERRDLHRGQGPRVSTRPWCRVLESPRVGSETKAEVDHAQGDGEH
jgi:hypothetical protein